MSLKSTEGKEQSFEKTISYGIHTEKQIIIITLIKI